MSAYTGSGNNKGKKAADVATDSAASKRSLFILVPLPVELGTILSN